MVAYRRGVPLDPIDQLLWDEAPRAAEAIALIDAPALVDHALTLTGDVRVWCDDWRDAQQVPSHLRAEPHHLSGVDLVLARLPKSLNALDEHASAIQGEGAGEATYLGGARIKHLNRSMNTTLGKHFAQVSASLGRSKSRVLRASGPRHTPTSWPRTRHDATLDLTIAAHGATFGGTKLDAGTALLLEHLRLEGQHVLDFGCGNGVISTVLARQGHRVSARDVSWSAVASTRATAAANDVSVDASWGDGLTGVADQSVDAIVTNPPFHKGFAKESEDTVAMFADARRVLRPGGELWCVFNSHLPWRRELDARLGRTAVVAQNPHFTVTRTVAPH